MIYERELAGIRAEVESLERARERAAGEASAVLDRAGDARRTLADAEASLSKLRAERASVAKEQAEVSREKQTEMQRMAEAEMDLQEQRERAAAGEEQHGALRAELEGVEKRCGDGGAGMGLWGGRCDEMRGEEVQGVGAACQRMSCMSQPWGPWSPVLCSRLELTTGHESHPWDPPLSRLVHNPLCHERVPHGPLVSLPPGSRSSSAVSWT